MATKKHGALCFLLFVLAMSASACGMGGDYAKIMSDKAVGRYIEIDVPLPEEIQNRNLKTIAVLKNGEKDEIEIYTCKKNATFRKYALTRYGNWDSEDLDWGREFGEYKVVDTLQYGLDGMLYAHLTTEAETFQVNDRFVRIDGEGRVEPICDSQTGGFEIGREGKVISGFSALRNGDLVIHFGDSRRTVVYDVNERTKKMTFEHYNDHFPGVGEHTASVIDLTRKTVCVYGLKDGGKRYEAKYSDNYMAENELLYYEEGKGTYLFNSEGVHYLAEGAYLWETLLEGKLASMGMPVMEIQNAFVGAGGDFYIYYESNEMATNNGTRLKHYVYDENSPVVPVQALTIYSLYENDLINQAIGHFQDENPGVNVNYRIVIPKREKVDVAERKDILSEAEYVRILDKEIREGDSADIVVCDGLPVQDYIEEGLLSDVGERLWPMLTRDEILPLAAQCYRKEGSVYAVPLRFEAFSLVGEKDVVANAQYLRTLIDYAKESGYGEMVASDMDWRDMVECFYYLYAHEFLYRDGKTFKKDRLVRFLSNVKELEGLRSKDKRYGISRYFSSTVALKEYASKKSRLANVSIRNILDFRELEGVLEYREGEACKNPAYKPLSTVGVPSNSGNRELAGKFIETLLSPKVQRQRYPNDAGVTVNQRALVEWLELEKVWNVGIYNYEVGEEMGKKIFEYVHVPSLERRDFYLNWFREMKIPLLSDEENVRIIKEESADFFEGRTTPEEAAVRITQRMAGTPR